MSLSLSPANSVGVLQLGTLFRGAVENSATFLTTISDAPASLGALSTFLTSQGQSYAEIATQLASTEAVQASLGVNRFRGVLMSGNVQLLENFASIIQPEKELLDEKAIREAVGLNERRLGGSIGRTFFLPSQVQLASSVYPEEKVQNILEALGELHELRIVSGLAKFIRDHGRADQALRLYQWALIAAEYKGESSTLIQDAKALGTLYRSSGYAAVGDLVESRVAFLVPEPSRRPIETIITDWEGIRRDFETLLDQFLKDEIQPGSFLQKTNSLRLKFERLRQERSKDSRFLTYTRAHLFSIGPRGAEIETEVREMKRQLSTQGQDLAVETVHIPKGEAYLLMKEKEVRAARMKVSHPFPRAYTAALPKEDPMRRYHEAHTAAVTSSESVLGVLEGIQSQRREIIGTGNSIATITTALGDMVPSLEYELTMAVRSSEGDPHRVMTLAMTLQCFLDAAHSILTELVGKKRKRDVVAPLIEAVKEQRKRALPLFGSALAAWRKAREREEIQGGALGQVEQGKDTRGPAALTKAAREDILKQLHTIETLPPEIRQTADALYFRALLKRQLGELGDAVQDLRQAVVIVEQPRIGQAPQVTISTILPLLVRSLAESGLQEEALQWAESYADKYPKDVCLLFAYAYELEKAEQLFQALGIYGRVISAGGKDPLVISARYNRALIYLQFHMTDFAIAELRKIIQMRPEAAEFFLHLGKALEQQSPLPLDDLVAVYEEGLISAARMMGWVAMGQSFEDKVLRESAKLAAQSFSQIFSQFASYEDILKDKKRYDLLERMARAFLHADDLLGSRKERAIQAKGLLGMALRNQGKVEGALKAFEESVSLDPDHTQVRFHYATMLLDAGRIDDAEREFEEIVKIGIRTDHKVSGIISRARAMSAAGTPIDVTNLLGDAGLRDPKVAMALMNLLAIKQARETGRSIQEYKVEAQARSQQEVEREMKYFMERSRKGADDPFLHERAEGYHRQYPARKEPLFALTIAGIQRHFFGNATAALQNLIDRGDLDIIDPALDAAIAAWQELSGDRQMLMLAGQKLVEFQSLVNLVASQRSDRIDVQILGAEVAEALNDKEEADRLYKKALASAPQSLYLQDRLAHLWGP